MSLVIKKKFLKQVAKMCVPINAFFAFLVLQPLEPVIYFTTMEKDLIIQATVAACLISLLFPIGISKQMQAMNEKPSEWAKGSFNSAFVSMVPINKYLALPVWILLSVIIFQIPTYLFLTSLNIVEMTGWEYFAFKMVQSFVFCVGFSYFVIICNITKGRTTACNA